MLNSSLSFSPLLLLTQPAFHQGRDEEIFVKRFEDFLGALKKDLTSKRGGLINRLEKHLPEVYALRINAIRFFMSNPSLLEGLTEEVIQHKLLQEIGTSSYLIPYADHVLYAVHLNFQVANLLVGGPEEGFNQLRQSATYQLPPHEYSEFSAQILAQEEGQGLLSFLEATFKIELGMYVLVLLIDKDILVSNETLDGLSTWVKQAGISQLYQLSKLGLNIAPTPYISPFTNPNVASRQESEVLVAEEGLSDWANAVWPSEK